MLPPWIRRGFVRLLLPNDSRPGTTVAVSPHVPERSLRPWLALVLLAGGVVVIVRLLVASGARAVATTVATAGPGVVLVMAAPAMGQLLHMLGWRLLLPPRCRPALGKAYRIFLAAQAGNELAFGLLGEPLKVAGLPVADRAAAVRAVILDNVTAAAALVGFFAIAGSIATTDAAGRYAGTLHVALGAVAVIAVAALTWKREHPVRLMGATGLHLLGKLWLLVELLLVTSLFTTPSPRTVAVLGLASVTAAAVGSPVPAQIGVTEAALVAAGSTVGIPASIALAIALLRRLRGVLWILVGAIVFPRSTNHALASPAE
jgi:hypothetical protein